MGGEQFIRCPPEFDGRSDDLVLDNYNFGDMGSRFASIGCILPGQRYGLLVRPHQDDACPVSATMWQIGLIEERSTFRSSQLSRNEDYPELRTIQTASRGILTKQALAEPHGDDDRQLRHSLG
jgi:hypothetical protein